MRRLAAAALLAAAGCGNPPTPKDEPAYATPPAARALNRRLHVFDTGWVDAPAGAVVRGAPWTRMLRLNMPAFAVERPDGTLVLFDLGLPKGGTFLFKQPEGMDLPARLERAGLDAAKVSHVALSHLHFDHVGDPAAFKQAVFLVAKDEWDRTQEKTKGVLAACCKVEPYAFDGPRTGTFERSHDPFGDGAFLLLDAAGHTPGSAAALVRLRGGAALLAGDSAWHANNFMLPAMQIYAWDKAAFWDKLWRLKEWTQQDAALVVFPGHDLGVLEDRAFASIMNHGFRTP